MRVNMHNAILRFLSETFETLTLLARSEKRGALRVLKGYPGTS